MNTDLATIEALTSGQALFAQAVAAGASLTAAYRQSHDVTGTQPSSVWESASRLAKHPAVAARIVELRRVIVENTIVTARQQLVDLAEMAAIDVTQLQRIKHVACEACNVLYSRDLLAGHPVPDMSDGLRPHTECGHVAAHTRVEIVPMEEWPAAARRLYEGVEIARDGTPRLVFRDRNQIQDQVNRLLGAYVTRTESITAHVTLDPNKPNPWSAASLTPAQIMERIRKGRVPLTFDHDQPATPSDDASGAESAA